MPARFRGGENDPEEGAAEVHAGLRAEQLDQKLKELPQLAEQLQSPSEAAQLDAVIVLRTLLSRERNPPVDEVVAIPGLVARLVQLLSSDNRELQVRSKREEEVSTLCTCWLYIRLLP
jgi:hypothetical protein